MRTTVGSAVLIALALSLVSPIGSAAQVEDENDAPPALDGLGWYRYLELAGEDIPDTRGAEEVAAWEAMLENAGASFDQLEYTYDAAFDPTLLPAVGALATFRVEGADADELHAAVVQDLVDQIVGMGQDPPMLETTTISGKEVTRLALPDDFLSDTASIYTSGDVSYVLLMSQELVAEPLERLP